MRAYFFTTGHYIMTVVETSKGVRIPFYQSSGRNGIEGAWLPMAGYKFDDELVPNVRQYEGCIVKGILQHNSGTGKTTFAANEVYDSDYRVHELRCKCGGISVFEISKEISRMPIPEDLPQFLNREVNSLLRKLLKEGF